MVDLRAAGHSRRSAATIVASELYVEGGTEIAGIAERLRKHYRELEISGELPKPATLAERKAEAAMASYRQQDADVEEARRLLRDAERKARVLDIDFQNPLVVSRLTERLREVRYLLDSAPFVQMVMLRRQGASSPEDVAKRLIKLDAERELLEKQLEVMGEVHELRRRASWTP